MPSLPFDRRWLLLVLVLPAIALATCASDEPGTFHTTRPILRITLDEYRISPQNIEAKAGKIKLQVRNVGRLTHNLVIETPPKDSDDEPVEVPGSRVPTTFPGRTAAPIKVTLRPGTYRLRCTIGNHDDLGQYGELHVTP